MSPVLDGAILPDLSGASIVGIVPSLLGARDRSWLPEPARDAEQVVLLLLDGLGWHAIQEHRDRMPVLAGMEGGHITSVVPSTTAPALTSVATGLTPAEHGIVGYRMRVGTDILNVLRWTVRDGNRPPDPFDVQRHTAFLGREVPVITRAEFRQTGFTHAHLRGGRFVGWHTTAMLIELCAQSVELGEPLTYSYYPGVDTVAHEFGLHDPVYFRELADTDRLVGELLDALPARAALLVTSDHGQMHLDPESWIELDALSPFVMAMAGDGRFRYLYAKPGAAKELAARARDLVGESGWVLTRAEVLEQELLGHGATGTVPGRVGDVVLAACEPVAYVDPALPKEAQLRSGHGSLTPDEMHVPLVAARGRRS